MSTCSTPEALDLLLKGTVTCHTLTSLRARLALGRPLRVKAGFDPTAPDLHLGHSVLLHKMAQFQQLGHTVTFRVGDFTSTDQLPAGIAQLKQGHPRDAKKTLARAMVAQFHGPEHAQEAEERWIRRFSDRQLAEAPSVLVPHTGGAVSLAKLLLDRAMASSRKDAERLLQQGAVSLDGAKVSDPLHRMELHAGETVLVRVGRLKLQRWVIQ